MPASMRVYSPLSNIDDDSVVAINALLRFFFPISKSSLFFFFLIGNSKFQQLILHNVKKAMSLGKKNLGAFLSFALQYVHKEVTIGKDGYCLKNNNKNPL